MARFLITAGPTQEPWDEVRYLSNRSSGRMGYALAREALALGHRVHLVTGPVALVPPRGAEVAAVVTAREMARAVAAGAERADVVIMAAAVADFRPARRVRGKIKKEAGRRRLNLELVKNPDILAGLGRRRRPGRLLVGFALEASRHLAHARAKLAAKGADLMVLNDVAAVGGARTRLTILHREGEVEVWPAATKAAAARRLVRLCLARLAAGRG